MHTFHGHSLTGYFSPRVARVYTAIERVLARRTDALVAVSPEVRDDLAALGVAAAAALHGRSRSASTSRRFLDDTATRAAARGGAGVVGRRPDDEVVTLVARLVPIKRVDRFLEIAASARSAAAGALRRRRRRRAARRSCSRSAAARALGDRLHWAGFRRDIADVCVASDVVVLTSDNEGTPVSLIEAQAAAVPVVSTDVGGVRFAVRDGETGLLAARRTTRPRSRVPSRRCSTTRSSPGASPRPGARTRAGRSRSTASSTTSTSCTAAC